MTDEVDWERAVFDLEGFAQEATLAAHLAGVGERLAAWRSGNTEAGAIAADALDQLVGILGDLAMDLPRIREGVDYLLRNLPPTLD